jgi:hypothetical protein
MCAIASIKLYERLKDLDPKLVLNTINRWDHVYVLVGGYIVDITASQFMKDPVFIKDFNFNSIWSKTYKHSYVVFDTPDQLVEKLKANGWPDEDLPKLTMQIG